MNNTVASDENVIATARDVGSRSWRNLRGVRHRGKREREREGRDKKGDREEGSGSAGQSSCHRSEGRIAGGDRPCVENVENRLIVPRGRHDASFESARSYWH